jgi:hypothetical protein
MDHRVFKDRAVLIGYDPDGQCVYSAQMPLSDYWDGEHVWDTRIIVDRPRLYFGINRWLSPIILLSYFNASFLRRPYDKFDKKIDAQSSVDSFGVGYHGNFRFIEMYYHYFWESG